MNPNALIGKKIGPYEIVSLIGHGGMAVVYRAYQATMKRDVAIKIVSNTLTQEPSFLERFNREIETITGLEHAHIVPVYDYGTAEDGIVYLVMRYIKGGMLSDRIRAGDKLSFADISKLITQIGDALGYAHDKGVIHRDLKPNNILLDDQGNAYLADFGLARMVEPDERLKKNLTETGTFLGTPTYISPEQVELGKADARSDLYSLGVILYEMVAGQPPFSGDSAFKLMQAHLASVPPPVTTVRPETPPAVQAMLEQALEKDPARRFQSARELASAFAAAIQGQIPTRQVEARLDTLKLDMSDEQKHSDVLAQSAAPTLSARPTLPGARRPAVRVYAAGIATALLVLLGLLALLARPGAGGPSAEQQTATVIAQVTRTQTAAPTPSASRTPAARPPTGSPADLALSEDELATARQGMQGSFIGVMPCALTSGWHASLARSAVARAREFGIETRLEDSEKDAFRQPAIVDGFTARGARAIFGCVLELKSLRSSLDAARQAGVKLVITGDTPIGSNAVNLTVTNERMGTAVGEYAARYINDNLDGKASVLILTYSPLVDTVTRAEAMKRALFKGAPNVVIVDTLEGGFAENGEKSMTSALVSHPDINVILSINDAGAFGAVKVLKAADKKPGDVYVFSVDAEPQAREMIRDGEFFVASFDNDPVQTGRLAVDALLKMMAGSIVPEQVFMLGQMVDKDTLIAESATPEATK